MPNVRRAQDAIDRTLAEFAPMDDCWLDTLDYVVHHDGNWVLDLSFRAFGNGAYPNTHTFHLKIDLRSGEPLTARAAFLPRRLPALKALLASRVRQSWNRARAQHPDMLQEHPDPNVTTENTDDFIVLADRIVFLFDYGLPHVLAVATPVSEFPIPIAELRPFIRTPGPLSWMR